MSRIGWMRAVVLAAGIACVVGTLPGRASAEEETRWKVGAAVATALYAPAKALYAATGALVGGIGWGLSGGNREAMDAVLTPAVEGDYVITPEHLRGERKVEFVGARSDAPEPGFADSVGEDEPGFADSVGEDEPGFAAEEGPETDMFGYPSY